MKPCIPASETEKGKDGRSQPSFPFLCYNEVMCLCVEWGELFTCVWHLKLLKRRKVCVKMTKRKNTKRALLASLLSVLLCVAMLIGVTFAWFTDSVTSSKNVIASGNLDVAMEWADGTEALDAAVWKDASAEAIFTYDKWEPGYTETRHVRIHNQGNLSLKYEVRIQANGTVSALADVIDVYYIEGGKQIADRTDLTDGDKIGTLAQILKAPAVAAGHLLKDGTDVATIALKMREDAGNQYQGLSIGTDFAVQLLATQYTQEQDSFDDQYDAACGFPVNATTGQEINDAIAGSAVSDITLLPGNNVTEEVAVPNGKKVTLTLKENSVIKPAGSYGIRVKKGGELTLSGTGNVSGEGYQIPVSNAGTLTIKDNVQMHLSNAGLTEGVLSNSGSGILYISNGSYIAEGRAGVGVKNAGGHAYISGGTFKGDMYAFFTSGNGVTEISGGTFVGTIYSTNGQGQSSTTTISGGTFQNGALKAGNQSKIIVTGGTFTGYTLSNVEQYLADGYRAVENDGVITVTRSE